MGDHSEILVEVKTQREGFYVTPEKEEVGVEEPGQAAWQTSFESDGVMALSSVILVLLGLVCMSVTSFCNCLLIL